MIQPAELDVHELLARGVACLHASAVTRDGRTIAFAGPRGAGKSTLAGALVDRGWQLVTDDILPVECATAMALPVAAPLRMVAGPGPGKLERDVLVTATPVRLVRIYFVNPAQRGPQQRTPMTRTDAVIAIAEVMPAPHEAAPLDETLRFERAVVLARQVPCERLRLPPVSGIDFARLVDD